MRRPHTRLAGRRRPLTAAALCALVALAVAPPLARAATPVWANLESGEAYKEGETVKVTASGRVTVEWPEASDVITCSMIEKGTVRNPAGKLAGVDTIEELVFPRCRKKGGGCIRGGPFVVAGNLPWQSELVTTKVGSKQAVKDVFGSVRLSLGCVSQEQGEFSGDLRPTVRAGRVVFRQEKLEGRLVVKKAVESLVDAQGHKVTAKVV